MSDVVASVSVSELVRNCSGLSDEELFGVAAFDYNTQLIRSYFGLPSHDWVHIKFSFVAVDGWNQTDMILEINDQESYALELFEGAQA